MARGAPVAAQLVLDLAHDDRTAVAGEKRLNFLHDAADEDADGRLPLLVEGSEADAGDLNQTVTNIGWGVKLLQILDGGKASRTRVSQRGSPPRFHSAHT